MDINGSNPCGNAVTKKRVTWTPYELLAIDNFVEAHPKLPTPQAIMRGQEILFESDRWLANSTIWNSVATGAYYKRIAQAKACTTFIPPPSVRPAIEFVGDEPEEIPPMRLDDVSMNALAEKVAAMVLPSLVDAMRDLVVSQRISKMLPTDEDIRSILEKDPGMPGRTSARRRIDVLGLLPSQAEVVKNYVGPRDDVKLRFILSEHASRVDRYAPDVIMCTAFVSHSHQDKARQSGSRIHYANGAAASVTNVLSNLIHQ